MRPLALLATFALAGAALPAQAITHIYVDAIRGDDKNPGTRAQPLKSITKGVANGLVDSVIHVGPGIYSPSKTGEVFTIQITGAAKNMKLIGTDPANTIIDFEKAVGSVNAWYFVIRSGAKDVEIANFTMKNGEFQPTVPWYSAAIWFDGVDGFELRNCIVEGCESGIYSANGSKNVDIHDNVFYGCNIPVRFRQDTTKGGGNCRFYNNVVAASTGGYSDTVSLSANDATQVFVNNLVMNNAKDGFAGTLLAGVVFENNNAWNNGGQDYNLSATPSKSNISVDPKIVDYSKRDFHLQSGSPMIEGGYAVPQPRMVNDFFGNARVTDIDGDGKARADIGAHEVSGITLAVSGYALGQTATFSITPDIQPAGPSFLLVAPKPASFVLDPFGVLGLDPATITSVAGTSTPGTVKLPIPSNPFLGGLTLHWQAFSFNTKAFLPSGRLDLTL